MELDSRPQVTTRLLAEPRLFVDRPVTTEPVKPDDTEETGEKNQTESSLHMVPPLVFQPILAPQPIRPPSPPPKPEPAYTDQVRQFLVLTTRTTLWYVNKLTDIIMISGRI